jgi:Concanavalin A-like lectin/glucanases superfamily/Putative Ig domain
MSRRLRTAIVRTRCHRRGMICLLSSLIISGSALAFSAPNARAAPPSYAQVVLADNPVAYWQFADPSGSPAYADSSGNGNTLPAGSTTLVSPGVGGADGAISTAGGGTYTTSSLAPLVGDAPRTVEAWFKTTSGGCVLSAGAVGHSQSFSLCFADGPANSPAPGTPGFYLQTWDADIFMPITGMTDGNWHYIGLTLSGSTVNIVIDGQQLSGYVWNGSSYSGLTTQPFLLPFTPNTTASPLGIGTPGWAGGLSGTIDEMAVYPSALSPNELVNHYQLMTRATPLAVITTSVPGGVVGQTYSAKLAATGGTPPYMWSVSSGVLPTKLGLNSATGVISGTLTWVGTSDFTVSVTDSSTPTQTASMQLSITVEPARPAQVFSISYGGLPLVSPPHVAFVLVGNWWCARTGGTSFLSCPSKYPYKCPRSPGGPDSSCSVEASDLLGALANLVSLDYNDSSPGGYDWGLSAMLGASGLQQRLYNGNFFAGPVRTANQSTLNSLAGGFGITSQADVNDTLFVLLTGPGQTTCPNASGNGPTGGGRPGLYGNFPTATVFLEDYAKTCSGPLNSIPGGDLNEQSPTPITPEQFATFAASHEIDEALTNVYHNTGGWTANGQEIADVCNSTDGHGTTGYSLYPYWNFTRDSRGTVVSAYVNPSLLLSQCYPNVDTAVPPG